MLRFRSVIGAVTIIFPAHSTEWFRGKGKMSMMRGESVPSGLFFYVSDEDKTPQSVTIIGPNIWYSVCSICGGVIPRLIGKSAWRLASIF
jgi:hypothetical protein